MGLSDMSCDYLIVGAGFFGAVMAERIANDLGKKVIVIDRRDHVGGNCYSYLDEETGIESHKYGAHIFHTNSHDVWQYINQFTAFNGYHHQVLAVHQGKAFQMPINLETINSFYGRNFTPQEAKEFIAQEIRKEEIKEPGNLEEKILSLVGRPLYEAFIKGYTIKQWGQDPKQLPASIIDRLPVRFDYREDYFQDCRWQGMPLSGYTKIFESLLSSRNIEVVLNCDYFKNKDRFSVKEKIIYTGRIDQFFDYQYGVLEWRAVDFERRVIPVEDFQGISVLNYADPSVPYTRILEPRHFYPERGYTKEKTVIFYETSRPGQENDVYYPVNTARNLEILRKYKEESKKLDCVIFGGRLGEYVYYDMDAVILAALDRYKQDVLRQGRRAG